MHDTLEYISKDPIYRRFHHHTITFSMIYAFNENFILPFSHDEVVHGKGSMLTKMPGDLWQKFANLRLLYAYMWAHPGKKLLFMGQEIGQWNEWNCMTSMDWHLTQYDSHRKLVDFMSKLNAVYCSVPALHAVDFSWEGFEWIDLHDQDNSLLSFMRKGKTPDEVVVCAFNFTPVPRASYRLGVPREGAYEQILNTDADEFGGSNAARLGVVQAEPKAWHNQKFSIAIALPPLGAVYFRLKPAPKAAKLEEKVALKAAPVSPAAGPGGK